MLGLELEAWVNRSKEHLTVKNMLAYDLIALKKAL